MRKKLLGIGILVMAVLAAGAWFGRKPLLTRWYIHELAVAKDERDVNYEGIAGLGEAAVPGVLDVLRGEQPAEFAGKALARIVERLPEDDARIAGVAQTIALTFGRLSTSGRLAVLEMVESLLVRSPASRGPCSEIVKASLKDDNANNRTAAIVLALRRDIGLGAEIVPLLNDPAVEVRRSAMLAIGSSPESIGAEDLLRWLHDPDREVRDLCEAALKSRGLRDKDLRMGRLVTDPSFLKRLEVIGYLPNDNQIDPQQWLQRLSQDPEPAVRAAAARVGMEPEWQLNVDFRDRVREMARSDPDGTVRQIADGLLQLRDISPQ